MRKKITIFLVILLFAMVIYNIFILVSSYINDIAKNEIISRPSYKVGILNDSEFTEEIINGFKDGMFDFGYSENKNIFYYEENINDEENNTSLEESLKKLSARDLDLVYTVSARLTAEAREYFKNKPIVFNIAVSPISAGLIDDYSSSGNNLTGLTRLSDELAPKRLEIFKNSFPGINRITVFYDPANKFVMPEMISARQAAKKIGLELREEPAANAQKLAFTLIQTTPGTTDGFFILSDPLIMNNVDLLIERANELRVPIMSDTEIFTKKGATISYGADYYELGKRSALFAHKILSGYEPKQLPVETPDKLELVVNLKNLRKNSLTVDQEIINLVSRFVE